MSGSTPTKYWFPDVWAIGGVRVITPHRPVSTAGQLPLVPTTRTLQITVAQLQVTATTATATATTTAAAAAAAPRLCSRRTMSVMLPALELTLRRHRSCQQRPQIPSVCTGCLGQQGSVRAHVGEERDCQAAEELAVGLGLGQ